MLQRTSTVRATTFPYRRLRLLIEDAMAAMGDLGTIGLHAEVSTCSGPARGEVCPLVMDGTCPLGPFDLVVTSLEGSWAESVHEAWQRSGVPLVDARNLDVTGVEARLVHHAGAAMQRVWAALEEPSELID